MHNIPLTTIMRAAYELHIPVPAFNIPHLPMVQPIVEAIRSCGSFALVEVALLETTKFQARSFAAVAELFNQHADRGYVRLHQDHVPVIDEDHQRVDWARCVREALDLGFDSVMVDGSRLSFEENVDVARQVAQMAHAKGAASEAELGAVLGHESGPIPPYDELFESGRGFTRVDEAQRFVEESHIDWLSVAIGNIHGAITGAAKDQKKVEARLNIEHLRRLSEATRIPLVLHGGSGIRHESVLRAIENGITKINVGTALRQTYEKTLKDTRDPSAAQQAVADDVREMLTDYFRIENSAARLAERIA